MSRQELTPEQLQIINDRIAHARSKKKEYKEKRNKQKSNDESAESNATEPELPSIPEQTELQPENEGSKPPPRTSAKAKGYCKIVFYEKPGDDMDAMKIKFKKSKGAKKLEPEPEVDDGYESDEEDIYQSMEYKARHEVPLYSQYFS